MNVEYLFLIEQELKFYKHQVDLGFIETPIKSLEQPYITNYPHKLLPQTEKLRNQRRTAKAVFKKYSVVIIDLKHFLVYKENQIDPQFFCVFNTKKNIIVELNSYNTSREKLIYLTDKKNIYTRIKEDFDAFDASSYDLKGTYLYRLSHNCPELVFFIEFLSNILSRNKSDKKSKLNLYNLKRQIELRSDEFKIILDFISSQIEYLEKRLSLESSEVSAAVSDSPASNNKVETIESSNSIKEKTNSKIIWLASETQLIDLFYDLANAKLLSNYSDDEVLSHFVNDRLEKFESLKKYCSSKLNWLGTDVDFASFINKLVEAGFVKTSNKYKAFCQHFLNNNGKEFKNLPQKFQNSKNFDNPNPQINEIIQKIINGK